MPEPATRLFAEGKGAGFGVTSVRLATVRPATVWLAAPRPGAVIPATVSWPIGAMRPVAAIESDVSGLVVARVIAFAKAAAEGQRAAGSFAVARRMARVTSSRTSFVGGRGMGSLACFISTATGVSAEKGTRPVKSSYATMPRA